MKKALIGIGFAALILVACANEPEETQEPAQEETKPEVEEVEFEEEKPEETVEAVEQVEEVVEEEEEKEVEQPAEDNFDKGAFIAALTKDMDENFGGTDEPMEWFKYITKYDVDYETKTVYAHTNIDTFNDTVTYDISNAMMNLINYDDQTYFHVKKFIVINAKGKEISVMNNRM